jgi:hypothetical protein
MAVMVYPGAWGKFTREKKTRSQKSRGTAPLRWLVGLIISFLAEASVELSHFTG